MLSFDDYLQDKLKDEKFAVGYEQAKADVCFGHTLAQRREMLGMTQSQLAEQTGIKQPMIARIEHGQMPKPATLQKLAKALNSQIVFTGEKIFINPIRERRCEANDMSDAVNSIQKLFYKNEFESEIPISNVTNINEYKKRRIPITLEEIEKYEDEYESIKSLAR